MERTTIEYQIARGWTSSTQFSLESRIPSKVLGRQSESDQAAPTVGSGPTHKQLGRVGLWFWLPTTVLGTDRATREGRVYPLG